MLRGSDLAPQQRLKRQVFSSNLLYFYKYVYHKRITTHLKVCCLCCVECVTNFIPFLEHVLALDMKYRDAHSGFCHQPL